MPSVFLHRHLAALWFSATLISGSTLHAQAASQPDLAEMLRPICPQRYDQSSNLAQLGWCLRGAGQETLLELRPRLERWIEATTDEEESTPDLLAARFVVTYLTGDAAGALGQLESLDEVLLLEKKEELVRAVRRLSELSAQDVEPDERLWRLGRIYSDLFTKFWNPGNDGFAHLEYPNSFFRKLVSKYPRSPWSDNALLHLSDLEAGNVQEGGWVQGNLKLVEKYRAILETYPGTDLEATVLLRMASLYASYHSGQPSFDPKAYRAQARRIVQDIRDRFPGTPESRECEEVQRSMEEENALHCRYCDQGRDPSWPDGFDPCALCERPVRTPEYGLH